MSFLNYHHLYYFWLVSNKQNISKVSKFLKVSQSSVSSQIKALEENFGEKLFTREKKRLEMTVFGKSVQEYANTIFFAGEELKNFICDKKTSPNKKVIKIGAISSISKNIQIQLLMPFLNEKKYSFIIKSAKKEELIQELKNHSIDIIISNFRFNSTEAIEVYNHFITEQKLCIFCANDYQIKEDNLVDIIANHRVFLPHKENSIRSEIDYFLEEEKIKPNIAAEIEASELMRFFILAGNGIGFSTKISLSPEIHNKKIRILGQFESITEKFYAITRSKTQQKSYLNEIIESFKYRFES